MAKRTPACTPFQAAVAVVEALPPEDQETREAVREGHAQHGAWEHLERDLVAHDPSDDACDSNQDRKMRGLARAASFRRAFRRKTRSDPRLRRRLPEALASLALRRPSSRPSPALAGSSAPAQAPTAIPLSLGAILDRLSRVVIRHLSFVVRLTSVVLHPSSGCERSNHLNP